MRKLQTKDVFRLARILKKGNIIESLEMLKGETDTEKIGMALITTVIGGCSDESQEQALYELVGDILGKTPKGIEEESITELIDDIKAIAKENDLTAFFKTAQQLTE